jgi:hypothetical protein
MPGCNNTTSIPMLGACCGGPVTTGIKSVQATVRRFGFLGVTVDGCDFGQRFQQWQSSRTMVELYAFSAAEQDQYAQAVWTRDVAGDVLQPRQISYTPSSTVYNSMRSTLVSRGTGRTIYVAGTDFLVWEYYQTFEGVEKMTARGELLITNPMPDLVESTIAVVNAMSVENQPFGGDGGMRVELRGGSGGSAFPSEFRGRDPSIELNDIAAFGSAEVFALKSVHYGPGWFRRRQWVTPACGTRTPVSCVGNVRAPGTGLVIPAVNLGGVLSEEDVVEFASQLADPCALP